MHDHQFIWLEPRCPQCDGPAFEQRTWCPDNVYEPCEACGRQPTKYIIAAEQLPPSQPEIES